MAAILDDYRWLASGAAEPWLAIARDEWARRGCGSRGRSRLGGVSVALLLRLRKDLSSERAHLVAEQVELRERATAKFSSPERMFFTRKGLEQATDEQIADYKAERFAAATSVADLCCGIGGDLIALARQGVAFGVDRDPVATLLAEFNLRRFGAEAGRCTVGTADAMAFPLADVAAWHIDPDRRPAGRRTTRVERYEPPQEAIERMRSANATAAVKLAPAAEAPAAWRDVAELEWLGSRDECRQQVVWFGSLARHIGKQSATIVDARGGPRTLVGTDSEPVPVAASLGRYLFEPHAAVLAARLTTALCREHALAAVSAGIAYLTGDQLVHDAALDTFEITDMLPLDRARLRSYCRERQIGRLEVKKRGLEIDVERLRKEVIAEGDGMATLIVTPVAGAVRAVIANRVVDGGRY